MLAREESVMADTLRQASRMYSKTLTTQLHKCTQLAPRHNTPEKKNIVYSGPPPPQVKTKLLKEGWGQWSEVHVHCNKERDFREGCHTGWFLSAFTTVLYKQCVPVFLPPVQ